MLPAALAFLTNPAFWGGAAKAAGGFIGAGGLSGLGKLFGGEDDEKELKTISTLSPEQQSIMTGLGNYLQSRIGQGLPAWTGGFTAPMSEAEQLGYGNLLKYISGGVGPTAEAGVGAFSNLLNIDPSQLAAEYMKYTAPAEQRYLKETMIPTFKESMVPGGTLRSTGTERGIGDIISKFGEGQLGRIGQTIAEARNRAAGLLPLTGTMSGIEGGVPQMEAAFQYGQIPRLIEQQELLSQIQEFIRTTPELSPILDKIQNYMGISTMGAYFG